jgi:hypothetical protein
VNNPLHIKQNDYRAPNFALHPSRLLRLGEYGLSVYVSVALYPRFAQNLMLFPFRIIHKIALSRCTTPNKKM